MNDPFDDESMTELEMLLKKTEAQDAVLKALQKKLDAERARVLALVRLCSEFRDRLWAYNGLYNADAESVYDFDVALLKFANGLDAEGNLK